MRASARTVFPARSLRFGELRAAFEGLGFAVTALEMAKLPFEEQVRAVSRATIVMLLHGAAMANFLFVRPRTTLIELTPYLAGETAEAAQHGQKVPPGRDAGKRLIASLAAGGVAAHHIFVPTQMGDAACSWSCYETEFLVAGVVRARRKVLNATLPALAPGAPPTPPARSDRRERARR